MIALRTARAWNDWIAQLDYFDFRLVTYLWALVSRNRYNLPLPRAAKAEYGRCWQFVWDVSTHHLDVDIDQDFDISWFYVNRETQHRDSGDQTDLERGLELVWPTQQSLWQRIKNWWSN